MDKSELLKQLQGGDLRSLALVDHMVATQEPDEELIDLLVKLMLSGERLIAMRAADAVEKITRTQTHWLAPHHQVLITHLNTELPIEIKWHLAVLVPRLPLTTKERTDVQNILTTWVLNRRESRLVRVHALQGLFDLRRSEQDDNKFNEILDYLGNREVPAMLARMRILRHKINLKNN